MKRKIFIAAILIFFLLINTSYYWLKEIGLLLIPIFLILNVYFLFLAIKFFFELNSARKERFRSKPRVFVLILLSTVLIFTVLFPKGMINFDKIEGKDLLVAYREGVANCTTTLKLKTGNKFKLTSVCFGIEERKGKYELKNDTIYFVKQKHHENYADQFKFGVLKTADSTKTSNWENIKYITLHKSYNDKIGLPLQVLKTQ